MLSTFVQLNPQCSNQVGTRVGQRVVSFRRAPARIVPSRSHVTLFTNITLMLKTTNKYRYPYVYALNKLQQCEYKGQNACDSDNIQKSIIACNCYFFKFRLQTYWPIFSFKTHRKHFLCIQVARIYHILTFFYTYVQKRSQRHFCVRI